MACSALVGLALAGVGAGISEKASSDERDSMNNVMNQEQAQQQQYQKQATSVFNNSLANSTPAKANQQIGQGANQALQEYTKLQASPLSSATSPLGLSTPQGAIVNSATQANRALQNQSAAGLQGYNNWNTQQNVSNTLSNANLGLISGQAQQAAAYLPQELSLAQNSEQGLAGLGSLLGSAGQLVGVGSATNWGQPASSLAGLGGVAGQWGSSGMASPMWLGQVAPQYQTPTSYLNFLSGGYN